MVLIERKDILRHVLIKVLYSKNKLKHLKSSQIERTSFFYKGEKYQNIKEHRKLEDIGMTCTDCKRGMIVV